MKTSNNGPQCELNSCKMNAYVVLLLCCVVGSAVGYYPQRQAPYNTGPNDPYYSAVGSNFIPDQSQRLFWGNQGSNQVGGTGLWATLTNKFPFLGNMFGRLELPTEYGVPNQYSGYQQYYQVPQTYQQQAYQPPQLYQQQYHQFQQRFVPSPGRDVGFTDDAIIVTPPQVPIFPQPAPAPQPAPEPSPDQGYRYNKPQYNRLELPHK